MWFDSLLKIILMGPCTCAVLCMAQGQVLLLQSLGKAKLSSLFCLTISCKGTLGPNVSGSQVRASHLNCFPNDPCLTSSNWALRTSSISLFVDSLIVPLLHAPMACPTMMQMDIHLYSKYALWSHPLGYLLVPDLVRFLRMSAGPVEAF